MFLLKKAFDFFLFSSIYIAVCAVVMSYQTFLLFELTVNTSFLWFVFFGTLCSYNFHWFFTPQSNSTSQKVQWSYRNKKLHVFLFFVSLIGAFYFAFSLKNHWGWLAISALITFLYSAPKVPFKIIEPLKKIAIGKTIFLALAWTLITAMLPFIIFEKSWTTAMEAFAVNRFFLIYPICILFDYRDRHQDVAEGIRSMITHFDERGINVLFWASLCAYLVFIIFLYIFSFSIIKCVVLLLPAVVLALLYSTSKKNTTDYLFYFLLDGLMMLSGLLFLLISFT